MRKRYIDTPLPSMVAWIGCFFVMICNFLMDAFPIFKTIRWFGIGFLCINMIYTCTAIAIDRAKKRKKEGENDG